MTLKIPAELRNDWEVISSGTVDLLPAEELLAKLKRSRAEKRPLRIKMGADPSAPDLHIGHTVPIRKLRQFQDLGHTVVFIIGDFTARIGDPSGKSDTRKRLTREEVDANAKTYLDQIFKILIPERTEVVYNSSWLDPLTFVQIIELASKYTVARMLERDDFAKRYASQTPIHIHEFLYPLIQGYDSVAVRADVEIGGTDQKFNLLVGRELQREMGQEPQVILTLPLLVGLDGVNKMSKSLDNYIGITEPAREIFGKAMSIPDDLMETYLVLALGMQESSAKGLMAKMKKGELHPRDLKARLARELTALYHSPEAAEAAEAEFNRIFREKDAPDQIEEVSLALEKDSLWIVKAMVDGGLAKSNREARKFIQQGSVSIGGQKVTDENLELGAGNYLVRVGKRVFRRLVLSKKGSGTT
ncbi:MAG: tyrosine--tRNA ligase [bacterium]